jgi:hypothetical protein
MALRPLCATDRYRGRRGYRIVSRRFGRIFLRAEFKATHEQS